MSPAARAGIELMQIKPAPGRRAIVRAMRLTVVRLVVLAFALLALPLQALAAVGPGGCPGEPDAAMAGMHGNDGGSHGGEHEGHAPLCGTCPVAAKVVLDAQAEVHGIAFRDRPAIAGRHPFASFSPEPDKRPPLTSA